MDIQNAIILVTGGSLGIGKATAKLLTDQGAKVIITGRNIDRLNKTANLINALPICADISKLEDNKKTIKFIVDKFGKLDVLINNAGIVHPRRPLSETQIEEFYEVFNTNVFGIAMLTKYAVDIFKRQKHGTIINIGSTASIDGYADGSVYVSSKFALRGLTKCWQLELSKFNIRVMLINPGDVSTAWGNAERVECPENENYLRSKDVAQVIKAMIELDEIGFLPEVIISPIDTYKKNEPIFN